VFYDRSFPFQLRDIFRVHPDTGCNTHDLLDCDCGGGSKHILKGNGNCTEDGEDDSNGDDEDSSDIGFVIASQVKPNRIEKMDRTVRTKSDLQYLEAR
jgi:DNA repair and recombination protein RAD54B